MELAAFVAAAAGALIAAILVVALKNPVHGAGALFGCMLSTAVLFALLRAPSLALLQVVVALGICLALFILSRTVAAADGGPRTWGRGRTGVLVMAGLLLLAAAGRYLLPGGAPAEQFRDPAGLPGPIGRPLFTDFLLPLGIVAALLIVVLVAVVALARPGESAPPAESDGAPQPAGEA